MGVLASSSSNKLNKSLYEFLWDATPTITAGSGLLVVVWFSILDAPIPALARLDVWTFGVVYSAAGSIAFRTTTARTVPGLLALPSVR